MAYMENREIQNPVSSNWESKTQIHEKSTKEQRNQNQPRPMRINQRTEKSKQPIPIKINPKNREIISNTYPWEINPKNTQRNQNQLKPMRNQTKEHTEKSKPKTQNTNHNPKLQKSNKSTNPRFMRRKEVEH